MKAVLIDCEGISRNFGGSKKHPICVMFPRKVALLYVKNGKVEKNEIFDINLKKMIEKYAEECQKKENNKFSIEINQLLFQWDKYIKPLTGLKLYEKDDEKMKGWYEYEDCLKIIEKNLSEFFDGDQYNIWAKDPLMEIKFLNNIGIYPTPLSWKKQKDFLHIKYNVHDLACLGICSYNGHIHDPLKEIQFFNQQINHTIFF